jgi:hypothetical protein
VNFNHSDSKIISLKSILRERIAGIVTAKDGFGKRQNFGKINMANLNQAFKTPSGCPLPQGKIL